MKKRIRLMAVLACAMVLCLALAACGGEQKDSKEAFLGSWTLAAMTADGEEMTAEEIELVKQYGGVGLTFADDGTFSFDYMGSATQGEWSADSATEATLSMDGASSKATISDDGKLVMEEEGTKMVFERGASGSAAEQSDSAN